MPHAGEVLGFVKKLREDNGAGGGGPHTHPISEVTTLQTAIDGKAAAGHGHSAATSGADGFLSGADKSKLDGIASGATANSTDAQLKDRANHTGAQAISTVTGLQTALDSKAGATAPDLTNVKLLGTKYMQQGAQTSKNAAATLTIAELLTGIIQYTGATANLTLPTGTLIDGGVLAGLPADRAFEFIVINTGSGPATLLTASNLTLVGSMAVTNGTSARFRVRKTATNTYTVYRV